MSKIQIRNYTIVSIAGAFVGLALLLVGIFAGATFVTDANGTHLDSLGNIPLVIAGFIAGAAAGVIGAIMWVRTLMRVAYLQRWGWFVTMLLFGPLVTLIWSIRGPDVPPPLVNIPQS